MADVGARIRKMRNARGLTLRQMSKLCGIPASTLSNIESKDYAISLNNLARIAAAFGVSAGTFLAEEAAPTDEVVPPKRRLVYQYPGLKAELLTRQADLTGLQIYLLTFEPAFSQTWADPHPGWEYLYILTGEADILVEGEEPVRVKTDDFFYFRTDRRHTVRPIAHTEMLHVGFGAGFLPVHH